MHAITCRCPKCSGAAEFEVLGFDGARQGEFEFEDEASGDDAYEYEFEDEAPGDTYEDEDEAHPHEADAHDDEAGFGARDAERPFSDAEEAELAMELLSVQSDAELDQFLGKLFKGAWRGLKKVGRVVGKVAKPLGRALKGVARTALPFVGGALGSLIPIPGVGTAVGTALGSAVGKALEAEFGELEFEEQQFEMARRFVRIAGTAARQAARSTAASDDPRDAARTAVRSAVRRHLPGAGGAAQGGGRWFRRGDRIVVVGA